VNFMLTNAWKEVEVWFSSWRLENGHCEDWVGGENLNPENVLAYIRTTRGVIMPSNLSFKYTGLR
jgi:hypothetical protein